MNHTKLIIIALFFVIFGFNIPPVFAANVEVAGRVSSGNFGSQGSSVLIKDSSSKQVVGQTTVDPSGIYSISVPKGTYDIVVMPPPESHIPQTTKTKQTISSNSEVNMTLPSVPTNPSKNYVSIILIIAVIVVIAVVGYFVKW